ncbi:MAG: arginyl-tRNA synthetase [Patescibacteria group bacterium]|nr:arginyl-tRNA synthetase [Patescibacteria group bacterium]
MDSLKQSIKNVVLDTYDVTLDDVDVTYPDAQFGDYSTNVAMQLAKKVGKNPKEIANVLAEKLKQNKNYKNVDVAGPGFINITLQDDVLLSSWSVTPNQIYKDNVVIAEYSDPNAFKALHAGHLYTTLVGNAIAGLVEATGATIYRLNYGGDVGLHAAKAMWGIINSLDGENPQELNNIAESDRSIWVSQRYVEGNTAYETNEQAKEQITVYNKQIYDIHTNNDRTSNFAQIYWTCRQWSYDGFDQMYKELGVTPFNEYIPESTVTPIGIKTVERGLSEGVFVESDGAIVYPGEKYGLHTRVFLTSKGLPTYEAKELGLALYKWQKYQFNKSIVITGNDIVEYMKVLFSAMTHFYPEVEQRTTHLTHGMIKLVGVKKMSSRKGNVLMANDIIESAIAANAQNSGKDNKDVAIGAIKYAFLKQRIGGDIVYNPDESISLAGNSGPYLQYAHARARSILQKSSVEKSDVTNGLDDFERALAQQLLRYKGVVDLAVNELMPHHICTYLYELTQVFNRFYENSKVIGDTREPIRKLLVERYADTLKVGLHILGITAPNKM